MVDNPDVIIDLKPDYCTGCGGSLEQASVQAVSHRQQIDLPPVKPVYTEYRNYAKSCSCDKITTSDFPSWVNACVSYGPSIEGLVSYLYARQYLPFARMQELFDDVFNVNIGQGGVEYLLKRFVTKATPVYQLIKQRVTHGEIVDSDETGTTVNGKNTGCGLGKHHNLTYISHSSK